jgi:hypothetical protein
LYVSDIIPLVQLIPYQRFGDFKIGGQAIRTMKYADDLVLPAKAETMLQGMIERTTEIERCYIMETGVEETKAMRIRMQPSPAQMMASKTNAQCRIYQLSG